MGVFEFQSSSESQTEENQKTTVSVLNHGGHSKRMTIPNEIAESHDIEPGEQLAVKETEHGFEVRTISL